MQAEDRKSGFGDSRRNRTAGLIAAAAVQALLGWALLFGLPTGGPAAVVRALEAFAVPAPVVPPPPPPRVIVHPRVVATAKPHASAAPIVVHPRPAPPALAAPPPLTVLPSPVVAAVADPGAGYAAAGNGSPAGSGGGPGGNGNGSGGDDGEGDGGVIPAQQIKGRLTRRDFPSSLFRPGTVTLSSRFVVGIDGRVESCTITESSGNAELDALVCRLIGERYVYRPARDRNGKPIREIESRDHFLEMGG